MALIGYARVSRFDQDTGVQEDLLRQAGCERVFTDTASGAHRERPGLAAALQVLQRGDVLVVWKLDRLGRSLHDLVVRVNELERRGVELRCLTQPFDTTTPHGQLLFGVFAMISQFERSLISDRTKAALAKRRAEGRHLGPEHKLTAEQVVAATELLARGHPVASVARIFGVARNTIYRNCPRPAKAPPTSPQTEKAHVG